MKRKKLHDNWNTRNFYTKTLHISCLSGYSSLEPSLWFHAFRTSARAFESSTQNTRGVSRDGEKRREQRAKRIEGEGLTRGKVNTRGFAMDIVKARAKLETSPSLVSFLVATWVASYTVRIFYSKRSIRFPHIYFVRGRSAYRCGNRDVLNSSTYPIQSRCRSFSPVSSAPESTSI